MIGRLAVWVDGRGFGFFEACDHHGTKQSYFVHVSAIKLSGDPRSMIGKAFSFDLAPGKDGKQKAVNARPATDQEIGEALAWGEIEGD